MKTSTLLIVAPSRCRRIEVLRHVLALRKPDDEYGPGDPVFLSAGHIRDWRKINEIDGVWVIGSGEFRADPSEEDIESALGYAVAFDWACYYLWAK